MRLSRIFQSRHERKRQKFADAAARFASDYPESFMIFADIESNVVVARYRDQVCPFYNRSQSRKLRQMFEIDPGDDYRNGNQSKRNKAIYQFLFEVDGAVSNIGQNILALKTGKKELEMLEKSGHIMIGSRKEEKGSTKEIAVVR